MTACRACYRPAPPGLKPGQAFVCVCFKADPNCRREQKVKARAKRHKMTGVEPNYARV